MTAALHIALPDIVTVDLLCFDLGIERFALTLSSVEEIVDASVIEPARNNGVALGVLRVRGAVLPVYDATRVLHAARTAPQPLALILPCSTMCVAVLVDGAEAVPRISLDGLRTPPSLISTDRVMEGVMRVGTRWVGLLNPGAFVNALATDIGLTVRSENES